MAKPDSKYRNAARPLLTSEEVMRLTGASRRTLSKVRDLGICEPVRFEDRRGVFGWSFGQVQIIEFVESLHRHGMPIEDIAAASQPGGADAAHARLVSVESDARHIMKRSLVQQRHAEDVAALGEQDGYYLRYLPQRWAAVVSCADPLPGGDAYVNARVFLKDLADHVGWCATSLGGTLAGPSRGGATQLAFCELAAQPVPFPVPGIAADGGCYHEFGGTCAFGEEGRCCELCPRAGVPVTKGSYLQWDVTPQDGAPVPPSIADAESSGSHGPWAEFTRLWAEGHTDEPELLHDPERASRWSPIAARPHWMPMACALPGIVGCIALPAGYYLCHQANEGAQADGLAAIRAIARTMRKEPLLSERASERAGRLEEQLREAGLWWQITHDGECTGPLSGPRMIGDPALESWGAPIPEEQVPHLKVFTMAGLRDADDYTIVCASLHGPRSDASMRYEFQLLVDETSIPKAIGKRGKTGRRSLRHLLGALPGGHAARDAEEAHVTRCRFCGAEHEVKGEAVTVCPACGRARALPTSDDPQALALLEQAEQELSAERWDAVASSCSLVRRKEPHEPEAAWLEMLARYRVSYRPGSPESVDGVLVGAPGDVPVELDSCFCEALDHANPSAAEIYRSEGAKLEEARKRALGREGGFRSLNK